MASTCHDKVQEIFYWSGVREPHCTIGAPFDKGLHPVKSCLIVRARRRNQIVSLVFERVYVLLPQRDTVLRVHVRLRRLVWSSAGVSAVQHKEVENILVHPKNFVGIALDDEVLEIIYLIPSPQHRDTF